MMQHVHTLLCQIHTAGSRSVVKRKRSEHAPDRHDAERETQVAHAVHDKGFVARFGVVDIRVPETDQQIRTASDAFPTHKHQQEVLAHHKQQHHEDEQVEIGKEAGLFGVFRHVAGRVDMDQAANARDDQRHQHGERIEQQGEIHLKTADAYPGRIRGRAGYQRHNHAVIRRAAILHQHKQCNDKRPQHHARPNTRHKVFLPRLILDKKPGKGVEQKPQQRQP